MANEASAILETVAGKVVVFDVCFVRGAKASRTLLATTDSGIHVYVDVDRDLSPVALTLVHRPSAPVRYTKLPEDGTEPLYGRLSALAAQVLALDREGVQKSQNTLSVPRDIRWR